MYSRMEVKLTTSETLQELEDSTFDQSDSFQVPPPDIIAYNELRSCADLFRMHQEGILEIQPDFQREIVWSANAQTRFIDSLVKQLPIPSMCFSLDYRTHKWQVIDGLQRMWAIIRFLSGDKWRLSRIPDVDPSLSGKYASDFLASKSDSNSNLRQYYQRIENTTLPITVIRCDGSKPQHIEYLFTIFHRLNTGAVKLNNQEIRNCIFSGSFNEFLRDRDQDKDWEHIKRYSRISSSRYRGQELILRFFAFQDDYRDYRGGLSTFLNKYMMTHRKPRSEFLEKKKQIFQRTSAIAANSIFTGQDPRRVGISIIEAVMVGVSLNLDSLENLSSNEIRQKYDQLLSSEEFSEQKLREGLSGTQRVRERLSTATRMFSGNGSD